MANQHTSSLLQTKGRRQRLRHRCQEEALWASVPNGLDIFVRRRRGQVTDNFDNGVIRLRHKPTSSSPIGIWLHWDTRRHPRVGGLALGLDVKGPEVETSGTLEETVG